MSTTLRLQTREQRKKLEPRDKPYFSDLRRGLSIGYRKGVEGGSWLLREFRGGKYVQRRLGAADDDVPADGVAVLSWTDAQKLALDVERPTVTRAGKHTVAAAWEAYKATRKTPPDVREMSTWERFIEPKLGSREVSEISHHELKKWLVDQVSTRGNRGQTIDGADEKDRLRRARYTANRRWNLLRAILNNSFESDVVKSDAAWRKVTPFAKVDRPRTVTVSAEQARALLTKIEEPLLGLAKGALYTGLRLSELIGLRADDIDVAGVQVRVRHGKGGERFLPLNKEGAAFFAERTKGKDSAAAVFEPMTRMQVARGMRAGSKAAGIVPRVTFHDIRRSYGSLMLNSGAAIESIQQVLGHADMRMTRRTYAHLLQKTVAKSVQRHLPSFNDVEPKKSKRRPRK
jgi:integrase